MRIFFMGTPDFAVPCLQKLIDGGEEVCAVFTQPDKPKGRHGELTPPPVKELAQKNNIPVFQPKTLRDGSALETFKSLSPDLAVVVAYGKILPSELLRSPKYGCINIHASLLPKLRGAAPIQWSIITGEKYTGVTAMQMDEGLDTGDMLLSNSIEIGENETAAELHDRLSVLGAKTLSETLAMLESGKLRPKKQEGESSYAPILTKELCPVDWTLSAQQVHNHIRGLYSWPGATAKILDKTIKIHRSALLDDAPEGAKPGEVLCCDAGLVVACGSGAVELLSIQSPGKRAMSAADYLRGNPVEVGTILE